MKKVKGHLCVLVPRSAPWGTALLDLSSAAWQQAKFQTAGQVHSKAEAAAFLLVLVALNLPRRPSTGQQRVI